MNMISTGKNSLIFNLDKNTNQGTNILPEIAFGNNSSALFEKELSLACKNILTKDIRLKPASPTQRNSYLTSKTSKGRKNNSKHFRSSEARSDYKTKNPEKTEKPGNSEENARKEGEREENGETHRGYPVDALNSALLLLGLSPGDAQKVINALKEGNYARFNTILQSAGVHSGGELWESAANLLNANSENQLTSELQNLISALNTSNINPDLVGDIEVTLGQLFSSVSKLNYLNNISGKKDHSFDFLGILGDKALLNIQETIPEISSSLAFWINSGLGTGENPSLSGLTQMMQTLFMTGTTKESSPFDIGDIAAKLNLTPLMNHSYGFMNPPVEELPLLMNSSFVDQLAARISNMATMGRDQLTFAIHPPELGSLKVLVKVNHGTVESLIQAASEEVKQLLDSKSHHLKQMLEQQGLNLTDFKVNLAANTSNANETWNFAWNENREKREFSDSQNDRNFKKNKHDKEAFKDELDIVT